MADTDRSDPSQLAERLERLLAERARLNRHLVLADALASRRGREDVIRLPLEGTLRRRGQRG